MLLNVLCVHESLSSRISDSCIYCVRTKTGGGGSFSTSKGEGALMWRFTSTVSMKERNRRPSGIENCIAKEYGRTQSGET